MEQLVDRLLLVDKQPVTLRQVAALTGASVSSVAARFSHLLDQHNGKITAVFRVRGCIHPLKLSDELAAVTPPTELRVIIAPQHKLVEIKSQFVSCTAEPIALLPIGSDNTIEHVLSGFPATILLVSSVVPNLLISDCSSVEETSLSPFVVDSTKMKNLISSSMIDPPTSCTFVAGALAAPVAPIKSISTSAPSPPAPKPALVAPATSISSATAPKPQKRKASTIEDEVSPVVSVSESTRKTRTFVDASGFTVTEFVDDEPVPEKPVTPAKPVQRAASASSLPLPKPAKAAEPTKSSSKKVISGSGSIMNFFKKV